MEILEQQLEEFIAAKVRSGQYDSREEVLRAGVTSLMHQDALMALPKNQLEQIYPGFMQKIADGLTQAKSGELSDGEEFFDLLEQQDQKQK